MKQSKYKVGFSILEVLISASIIGIITAVIVVRYGSFNNAVLLKSQAYEIALDIREAQTYAVSVQGESGVFREDYGVYFDLSTPDQYLIFLDSGDLTEHGLNAAYYDDGEQVGLTRRLDSRFEIQRLCVNNCSTDVDDLSVSFKRPDFDGQFSSTGAGLINDVDIVIRNVLGDTSTRTIEVSQTGQIDVD